MEGKRPDGITLVPWGREASPWDATLTDAFSLSYYFQCHKQGGCRGKEAVQVCKHVWTLLYSSGNGDNGVLEPTSS